MLEIIADPDARAVEFCDSEGRYERVDASVEVYSPASIPAFHLHLRAIFDEMDIPELP